MDRIHLYVACKSTIGKDATKDTLLDSWVNWLESKDVPYRVTFRPDGRRELFKHMTRAGAYKFHVCCGDFNPSREGRDLKKEAAICGRSRERPTAPS